ncbi:hypothetical protein I3760_05G172800, partial [Carya illinoinensis]
SNVWSESLSVVQKWKTKEADLLAFMEKFMKKLSQLEMEEIATVIRSLWLRRNEFIFEGKFKSPNQIQGSNEERRNLKWKKPREDYVKANWDAVVNQEEMKVGVGVVIRDRKGKSWLQWVDKEVIIDHPAIVESHTLWKAVEVCRDLNFNKVIFEEVCRNLNFNKVIFEGDSKVIVNAVNDVNEDISFYGSVIEDIKKLLNTRNEWNVQFVYENSNEVAHLLAKEVLHLQSELVLIEEVPNCIRNIVERERSCTE